MTSEATSRRAAGLHHYEIVSELSRREQVRTWAAVDRRSGQEVVVKSLSLRRAAAWKSVELFERESAVLRRLSHPGIPSFLDAFQEQGEGDDGDRRLFLVQVRAPGEDLARRVAREGPLPMEEVIAFASDLLQILAYLHGFTPPVVHRDIKPSNLVRSADGQLALVDFGGVQTVLADETGSSTVVGTAGYMAPEQLMGRAAPASDLFGVGATIVHLLTGDDPAELPRDGFRLQWNAPGVEEGFRGVIDTLLSPAAEDRPASASQALAMLRGEHEREEETSLVSDDEKSDIFLHREPYRLTIVFPQERRPTYLGRAALIALLPSLLLAFLTGATWVAPVLFAFLTASYAFMMNRCRQSEAELRIDRGSRGRGQSGPQAVEPARGMLTVVKPVSFWPPTSSNLRQVRVPLGSFEGLERRPHPGGFSLHARLPESGVVCIARYLDEAETTRVMDEVARFLRGG